MENSASSIRSRSAPPLEIRWELMRMNHEVNLLIRSQDVIHNFYVRELRIQQDAMPGMVVPLHFTANAIGQYEVVCTQLCGLGHSRMHSYLNVVSDADYEAFLKQQAAGQ
jgi:cytochrome c oxidase subunit 2